MKMKIKQYNVRFQHEDIDKLNKIKLFLYNYKQINNLPVTQTNKDELYKLFNDIYKKVIRG